MSCRYVNFLEGRYASVAMPFHTSTFRITYYRWVVNNWFRVLDGLDMFGPLSPIFKHIFQHPKRSKRSFGMWTFLRKSAAAAQRSHSCSQRPKMPQIPGTVAQHISLQENGQLTPIFPLVVPFTWHGWSKLPKSTRLSQYRIVSLENYYHYPHIHSYILTLIIFIYVIIIDYIIYIIYKYILYIYILIYYIIYVYISRMENFKKVWSSCFASRIEVPHFTWHTIRRQFLGVPSWGRRLLDPK